MTTATLQQMIRAAEVLAFDEESREMAKVSTLGEVHDSAAEEVISRISQDRTPLVINRSVGSNGSTKNKAVLAIPIIAEQSLLAILILYIECAADAQGAIEIWSRDERDELGLNGAVFANLGRFAGISKHVRFPRGSGLPGQSWEDRECKLLTGLGRASGFMRAAGARVGGLDVGIALPVMKSEHDLDSVLLLLSSVNTPLARVFEIWDVDSAAQCLHLRRSAGLGAATIAENAAFTYAAGEGIVGKVWSTGVPLLTDDVVEADSRRAASAKADGITSAIAIPIYVGEFLKSVLVILN